jgi:HK97 gp10 family phage protein
MARTVIEVKGLRELGEKMRGLSAKVNGRIASAATGAAAGVIKKATVANIVRNPSVDTGSLRDSVIVKKLPKGQAQATSAHIVTFRGRGKPYNKKGQKIARAPHAHLLEFGTVHMLAEPSLRPAFDSEKMRAVDVMADRLRKGIDKATK